jgi:hypothetical protein
LPCPDADADDWGDCDWLEPESEHAAAIGITVAAVRASTATFRRTATRTFW